MKILKSLLVLPALMALQSAFAQTDSHLKLSDQYPAGGESITLTYDATGTIVDGKKDITAEVFYLDNKEYPVDEIDLKQDGKLLRGEFTVNPAAKAFFIKISSGSDIDNNNDKGYVFMVYKDKQAVQGAYASEAYLLSSGMGGYFARIKTDVPAGVELYKKEFSTYPSSDKENQLAYYSVLARAPGHTGDINQKVSSLEKSNDETDLILASNLLRLTKNTKSMDSLDAVIKVKFPDGEFVKGEASAAFFKEKDPAKKDALYQAYLKKYTENTTQQQAIVEDFRFRLAIAYLQAGDIANYQKYESQLKNKYNLAGELNNIAYEWAKKGERLDEAAKLSKQSLEIVSANSASQARQAYVSPTQMKKNYAFTYDLYADTYAFILFKQGKYSQALQYEQPVIDHSKTIDPDEGDNYLQILIAAGQTGKAKDFAERVTREGQGTALMKDLLKKEFFKAKGSDNGFDQYIASLESTSKSKARQELAKTMINQPAPAFALKDLDGKSVSLADLKGKVVIVDFWATWCGPCKASFPGMQMALNKYKEDPNVKFLFVDTWENGENYLDGVKKFIADNKYTFHVLMDEKDANGKQAKVVSAYEVTGIPTKFIIDKKGNIRFKYIGYSGTADKLVDEVTDMIDMATNPDTVAAAPGSGNSKSK